MMIFADKPLSIKESWSAILKLFVKTFPKVWPVALIFGMVEVLLLKNMLPNQSHFFSVTIPIPFPISISILTFVYILLSIYIMMLLLHRIYVVSEEQDVTLIKSCGFVLKKLSKMFVVSLLAKFGMLAFFGVGVTLYLMGIVAPILLFLPFLVVFCVLWYVVTLYVLAPLVLFDNKGVFGALKDSYKLIWGNWWYTFITVVLPSVVLAILPLVLYLFIIALIKYFINWHIIFSLPGFYLLYDVFISGSLPSSAYFAYQHWLLGIVGVLFAMLFYSLFYSAILIQFGNLKARKAKACKDAQVV